MSSHRVRKPGAESDAPSARIGADEPRNASAVPTIRRSILGGRTLVAGRRFDRSFLLRHRGRRAYLLDKRVEAFRPVYHRRDMLKAFLRMALLRENVAEIQVQDKLISSIALTTDDEGKTRLVVRSKRGRKAP